MQSDMKSPKPQELQRLLADLNRRSKELDARESYLDEREQILESGPLDLKVLEETIAVKTKQHEQDKAEFLKKETWYKQRLGNLEGTIVNKEDEIITLNAEVGALEVELKDRRNVVSVLKKQQESIEREITERGNYLKEQERLISETIDEGNAALRGIGYEIQAAQDQGEEVKQEVADLESKKTDVAFELIELEERYKQDEFRMRELLESIREECTVAEKELIGIQKENEQTVADTKSKLRQLNIKEQELMTKQGAIVRERTELEDDKRRWHSTKSLYDV